MAKTSKIVKAGRTPKYKVQQHNRCVLCGRPRAFIRNFGPLHLGEITGFCTSIMVFASAIGPALFSLGLDYSGSYATAQWLCIVALVLLLGFAIVVTQSGPNEAGKTAF